MSNLSKEEITHLATLARIRLTDEEIERLGVDMPKIVEFVEQLKDVPNLSDVELRPVDLETLRDDTESSEKLSHSEQEELAPKWADNQIEVPGVFDESGEA